MENNTGLAGDTITETSFRGIEMKNYVSWLLAVLLGIALAAGGIPSVYAQDDTDEFTLEEVTVTAQKRAENLQKVPIQMDVISGEELLGTGKDNVDDILRDVSSVLINKAPDGMRITLRGLADDQSYWNNMHVSTPQVAVNIDGAYNSSSSAGQNLFDVERVEVLYGPQSTIYGSNSPGGVVNVVTAAPKTDKFATNVSAEMGNYGLFDGQVMVNVPVIQDLLGMRLSGQMYKRDTFLEDYDANQDTKTARLKTLFQPSENFSANLTLNYSKAVSAGRLQGEVAVFDYQDGHYYADGSPVTNPWTRDVGGGAPPPPPPPPGGAPDPSTPTRTTNTGDATQRDAETKGAQLEINWDTNIGSITFVPYYNRREAIDLRDDVEVYFAGQEDPEYTTQKRENSTEQKGADMRIVSPEDFFFKWILGGTWFESEDTNFTDDYYYDSNDRSNLRTQKNKAVYANVTYPITDSFRGTAGYRRSWDETGNIEAPPKVGNGISGQSYSSPDYKLGVEYDLAENTMVYADYATSYRVNAMAISTNAGVTGGRDVPPEKLKSYQLGAKNRFFDNRLQVNASIYYYDYQNKQFRGSNEGRFSSLPGWDRTLRESAYTGYDKDGVWHDGVDINNDGDYNDTNLAPGSPDLLPGETSDLYGADLVAIADPWVQQYGSFESKGIDVSADWIITSKDRLNLQVSYLDSKWKDCTVEFYWDWIWPTEGLSYSGKRATYASKWSVSAYYEHKFELGSFGTLTPRVDMQYKSDYYLDFQDSWYPYNYQEPYTIWNGSMTFNHSSGKWSVNAYVKNIDEYAAKTFWQAPAGTPRLGINDPRTYGAVLSMKF